MCMVCVNTHVRNSNVLLIFGIRLRDKDKFCTAALLLLYKKKILDKLHGLRSCYLRLSSFYDLEVGGSKVSRVSHFRASAISFLKIVRRQNVWYHPRT